MRILLINPNMTEAVTNLMLASGRSVAAPATELAPVTARWGFPFISSRAEAQVGGHVALELLAEHGATADGAIIAAFGDPGVAAARELFDFPVVGVSEAAMLTACMLGRSFAIFSFSADFVGWFRDCVDQNGLTARCTGVHSLDLSVDDFGSDFDGKDHLFLPTVQQVARNSGADSLIFGGAPLAGLAQRFRDRIPLPVIDPAAAAVKQIEALAALQLRKATAGTYRRPPAKTTTGLTDRLAARIERRDDDLA